MNDELAFGVKRYKRRVKANLLCSTGLSRQFLSDLSDSIDNYIEENNVTRLEEVRDHFGTPEQIARSFLAETDISVIRKKVRLKQIILLALIAALLIWAVGVAISTKTSYDARGGYGIEEPAVIVSRSTETDS
jgi:hypothetical protein